MQEGGACGSKCQHGAHNSRTGHSGLQSLGAWPHLNWPPGWDAGFEDGVEVKQQEGKEMRRSGGVTIRGGPVSFRKPEESGEGTSSAPTQGFLVNPEQGTRHTVLHGP